VQSVIEGVAGGQVEVADRQVSRLLVHVQDVPAELILTDDRDPRGRAALIERARLDLPLAELPRSRTRRVSALPVLVTDPSLSPLRRRPGGQVRSGMTRAWAFITRRSGVTGHSLVEVIVTDRHAGHRAAARRTPVVGLGRFARRRGIARRSTAAAGPSDAGVCIGLGRARLPVVPYVDLLGWLDLLGVSVVVTSGVAHRETLGRAC